MDSVMFLKEWKRMCDEVGAGCSQCPLHKEIIGTCLGKLKVNPEKAVEIVEKWSKENPVKTMAMDFFEKYPNAPKDECGFPSEVCPYMLGYGHICPYNPSADECAKCWSRPLEVTK